MNIKAYLKEYESNPKTITVVGKDGKNYDIAWDEDLLEVGEDDMSFSVDEAYFLGTVDEDFEDDLECLYEITDSILNDPVAGIEYDKIEFTNEDGDITATFKENPDNPLIPIVTLISNLKSARDKEEEHDALNINQDGGPILEEVVDVSIPKEEKELTARERSESDSLKQLETIDLATINALINNAHEKFKGLNEYMQSLDKSERFRQTEIRRNIRLGASIKEATLLADKKINDMARDRDNKTSIQWLLDYDGDMYTGALTQNDIDFTSMKLGSRGFEAYGYNGPDKHDVQYNGKQVENDGDSIEAKKIIDENARDKKENEEQHKLNRNRDDDEMEL